MTAWCVAEDSRRVDCQVDDFGAKSDALRALACRRAWSSPTGLICLRIKTRPAVPLYQKKQTKLIFSLWLDNLCQ